MFEPDQRPEAVDASLAGRSTAGGWAVGDGVVEVHALGCGGVGEAAGGHSEEHGFADPPGDFIAVNGWGVLRIDDRLHFHVATGVGQEAADLAEGEGSDAFRRQAPPATPGLPLW